jgi:hypothetical protein
MERSKTEDPETTTLPTRHSERPLPANPPTTLLRLLEHKVGLKTISDHIYKANRNDASLQTSRPCIRTCQDCSLELDSSG